MTNDTDPTDHDEEPYTDHLYQTIAAETGIPEPILCGSSADEYTDHLYQTIAAETGIPERILCGSSADEDPTDTHDTDMERYTIRRATFINEDTDEERHFDGGGMQLYNAADKYELRIPLELLDPESTRECAHMFDGWALIVTTEDGEHHHAIVSETMPITGTTLGVRWYDADTVDPQPSIRFTP